MEVRGPLARRHVPPLDLSALAVAVALPVAMAVLGTLLAGSALKEWFAQLKTPRWHLPMWAFISVGAVGYVLDAVILYRLLTLVQDASARIDAHRASRRHALQRAVELCLHRIAQHIRWFRWRARFPR